MALALRADFILVAFGRLVTALVAVAALRVITTLLEPTEYGQWALLIAFQTFCALFLINPVDQHLFRHAHAWWDEGVLFCYLKRFDQYIRLVSIFIILVVMVWARYTQSGNESWVSSLMEAGAVGIVVYFGTWSVIIVTLLNVLGFRIQSVAWAIVSVSAGLLLSTLFAMQDQHAISWIFGQALGAAVGALGAWKTLRGHAANVSVTQRSIHFSDFLSRATIKMFCLPLAAATGFMWLQNTGYRFWVNDNWGTAELAILVVGLGVSAQLAGIVESLAMQFLYPYFARRISDAKSNDETAQALSDVMNVLAPVYALWAGFNAICAAVLLEVLTDARYHVAVPFVVFGAMIEFARCTTNLWSNTARAVRATKGLILPYGLGAAVVWIGGIGAAHFGAGLTGLSGVLVTAGFVTCGAMIVSMQRLLHVSVDVPRLIIGLVIMAMSVMAAVFAPIQTDGIGQNLAVLIIGGIFFSILGAGMFWKNPALTRLLSTALRKEEER